MEKAKTAEEVLGETYTALLGSNKNFIIAAMDVYSEQAAEKARKEEREKILDIVKAFTAAVNAKLTCREMIVHMNPFFKAAGYELEKVEIEEEQK